jgi:hypothetical protein
VEGKRLNNTELTKEAIIKAMEYSGTQRVTRNLRKEPIGAGKIRARPGRQARKGKWIRYRGDEVFAELEIYTAYKNIQRDWRSWRW